MAAKVAFEGEIARIVLSGAIDFSTQDKLAEAIDKTVASDRTTEIRVDMGDASFIDSSVIRALLQLQERAREKGKTVSIWNCNDHIREIFVIGGFDQMLVIY